MHFNKNSLICNVKEKGCTKVGVMIKIKTIQYFQPNFLQKYKLLFSNDKYACHKKV